SDCSTRLLGGNKIVTMPLYMAVHLQKRNLLRIVPPREYAYIENFIEKEIEMPDSFCELPEYFFEIAKILKICESEIEKLKEVRRAKIWKGLRELDGKAIYVKNLTRWEFNQIKGFIVPTLKENWRISQMAKK
ncbi:hypothetical protein EBI_27050, partial [Enterocytozoon bieneusi H348]